MPPFCPVGGFPMHLGRAAVAVGVMVDTDVVKRALRVRFWQEHGLTIPQIGLMFVLYEATLLSGRSVGGTGRVSAHTRATVTGLVTWLDRAGYAHRGKD
jgi:hypothetical protein